MSKKLSLFFAVFGMLLFVVFFCQPCFAQAASAPPSNGGAFTLTASPMALPGGGKTVAASVLGETYSISNNLSVRADEILAPGNNTQVYVGGVQYFVPMAKLLSKTKLNSTQFQFYVTGSVGIDRIVPATGPSAQHISLLAGGGLNYSPAGSGKFSINLFEIRYARLPGLANNTALVSSGLKLTF